MKIKHLWPALALLVCGPAIAQDIDIQLELQQQVGTDVSRKGDLVTARVLSPANLLNDTVEGRVNEVRSGSKVGGQSVLSIHFDTLRHGGTIVPISAQMKSVTNSRGQANLDDEGRVMKRATGNVAKVAGGGGVGALIGRAAGGAKGAAVGAAAGAV